MAGRKSTACVFCFWDQNLDWRRLLDATAQEEDQPTAENRVTRVTAAGQGIQEEDWGRVNVEGQFRKSLKKIKIKSTNWKITCLFCQVEQPPYSSPSLSPLPLFFPDMGRPLALTLVYLSYLLSAAIGLERQQHHVQHGPCSYTFILPEVEHCHTLKDFQVTNTLQRDSPPEAESDMSQSEQAKTQKERPSWQERKLESLETAMENNTQWLLKVRWSCNNESYRV